MFVPTRRTTLLVQTGDGDWHLFFVLTDAYGEPPAVLMANASSVPDNRYVPYDKTCLLEKGEHAFIKHPSYIAYQFAEVVPVSRISQKVARGEMKVMRAAGEECYARICAGLVKSPSVPLRCKTFYGAAMAAAGDA